MISGTADRRFKPLIQRFAGIFRRPSHVGGALAVYWRGEPVVDVWTGYADAHGERPWERDTAAMSFSTTKGVARDGSGAWADPETGMSLAFVTNRLGSVTTPVGDVRLPRLGAAALAVARRYGDGA